MTDNKQTAKHLLALLASQLLHTEFTEALSIDEIKAITDRYIYDFSELIK